MLRSVIALVLTVLLGACAPRSIEVRGVGVPITSTDGTPVLAFRFEDRARASRPPRALVLYLQGSDARSVAEHADALAGFCAMGARVVAVERRGVRPDAPPDLDAFNQGATLESRVADGRAALAWGLAGAPTGVPVILLGASEGADVASRLATLEPAITHVILLGGGGGWTQAEEFRHFLRARGRLFDVTTETELGARLADIRAHPDAGTLWAGLPYRRWSSFMFRRPADDLLTVDRPILAIQGDQDSSVPIESARALRSAFAAAGRTNLTLVEIPGADHAFADPATRQSKRPLVELAVVNWLAAHGVLTRAESGAYSARVRRAHPELFGRSPAS